VTFCSTHFGHTKSRTQLKRNEVMTINKLVVQKGSERVRLEEGGGRAEPGSSLLHPDALRECMNDVVINPTDTCHILGTATAGFIRRDP
jgi:hypothetical protein